MKILREKNTLCLNKNDFYGEYVNINEAKKTLFFLLIIITVNQSCLIYITQDNRWTYRHMQNEVIQ